MNEKQRRARYTAEFKQEAVRQVKAGRSAAEVARTLGVPKASLSNWVRAEAQGRTAGTAGGKAAAQVVTPEQAEIARLRAEVARLNEALAVKSSVIGATDAVRPRFRRRYRKGPNWNERRQRRELG